MEGNMLTVYGPGGKYYSEKEEKLTLSRLKEVIKRLFWEKHIMKENINELVATCYGNAKAAGWHPPIPQETEKFLKGTQLMLMVSEIAEAMEGERKGLKDAHLKERPMVEVELADAIIRIADYCGRWGYDLGGAVVEKLEYNKSRLDHKPENRAKEGGKSF